MLNEESSTCFEVLERVREAHSAIITDAKLMVSKKQSTRNAAKDEIHESRAQNRAGYASARERRMREQG